MKTANELQGIVSNIRYYSSKLYDLAHQQFEFDAQLNDINTKVGSIRFDALAEIGAGANRIKLCCDNIEANLKTAIEQDKKLHLPDEGA